MSNNDPNVENLTEEQLFSRMSRSIKDNDFESLDKLAITDENPNDTEVVVQEVQSGEGLETQGEEVVATESPDIQEASPAKEAGEVEQPHQHEQGAAPELPKEVQDELTRLRLVEQRLKSEMGRVPKLQSKLAELERKLQKEQPRTKAAESDGDKIVDTSELEDALAQIGEVDPVTAKALQLLRQEALGSVKKTQSILQEKEEAAVLEREWGKLVEQVPQAPEVFQHPLWEDWKAEQTPGMLNLATSVYADEVVVAIEKFAKDMNKRFGYAPQAAPSASNAQTVNSSVTPPAPVKSEKAEAVAEQRNRRLAATTPSSSPAPQQKEVLTDPEAIFKQAYAEIVKKDHLDRR